MSKSTKETDSKVMGILQNMLYKMNHPCASDPFPEPPVEDACNQIVKIITQVQQKVSTCKICKKHPLHYCEPCANDCVGMFQRHEERERIENLIMQVKLRKVTTQDQVDLCKWLLRAIRKQDDDTYIRITPSRPSRTIKVKLKRKKDDGGG